jgi:signal peptidase I
MRPLRHLVTTLIAILIAVGVVIPVVTHLAPVVGREVFAVRGGSMDPGIPMGALVIIGERPTSELGPADVITWKGDNGVRVTHRIVDAVHRDGELMFQTHGDANESPDGSLVPARAVVGAVEISIPLAGYVLMLLSTPSGLLSWLSFGLALLVADTLLASPPARRATGWPIHFVGVTVEGDDLGVLDVMLRCSEGDHRACPETDIAAAPEHGAGGRTFATA